MRSVALVLSEDFGGDLREMAFRSAVWLIDTDANRNRADELWRVAAEWPQVSVTLVRTSASPTDEDWRHVLAQIELHHGPGAQRVPYDTLEVIGSELTASARTTLLDRGFLIFEPTPEGFRARKAGA